jgi:hypothetical protein
LPEATPRLPSVTTQPDTSTTSPAPWWASSSIQPRVNAATMCVLFMPSFNFSLTAVRTGEADLPMALEAALLDARMASFLSLTQMAKRLANAALAVGAKLMATQAVSLTLICEECTLISCCSSRMLGRQPVHTHLPKRTISLQRMGMSRWRCPPKAIAKFFDRACYTASKGLLLPFRLLRPRNSFPVYLAAASRSKIVLQ